MTGALVAQANSDNAVAQVRNVVLIPEGSDVPDVPDGTVILFFSSVG